MAAAEEAAVSVAVEAVVVDSAVAAADGADSSSKVHPIRSSVSLSFIQSTTYPPNPRKPNDSGFELQNTMGSLIIT